MITVDRKNKLITLHTKNTTYQMKVWDCNILLHSYYGSRVTDGDLSYLLRRKDRGFSPNPSEAGLDRTFSLDTFPREYSTSGVGDFRLPSAGCPLSERTRTFFRSLTGG